MLRVNEIFHSIQGESTFAGLPCVFVRLTYCNLRCVYCDTEYAFYEGSDMSVSEIVEKVKSYNCKLVEVTGGEPLMQDEVHDLMKKLCDEGFAVMLETGGSLAIDKVDTRVKIIMDLKTPFSKMEHKNRYENLEFIKPNDEIKFVIGSKDDYDWCKEIIEKYDILKKCVVLMSPVFGAVDNAGMAKWILDDSLGVRFQLQMHKYIWHPETRGV